jgi:uncharacterized protein (TIGR02453 family)
LGKTASTGRTSSGQAASPGAPSLEKTTSPPRDTFAGFPDEAIQFLLELQAEQSRIWFKAHQDDFVRFCRRPLELLVAHLQAELTDVYPEIADVDPHIFRIQRDTRFAKDKSPYKTNLAANIPLRIPGEGDHHTTPGIYLSFGLDGDFVALGAWHMEPPVLARYRELLDRPRVGAQLNTIVAKLATSGWQIGSMEALKRVPSPYPQDHPCAELLKRKGLAVSIQPEQGISARPEFADWAVTRLREAAPMIDWLDRHLGQPD